MRRVRERGFTIIDLLVVIAVVTVLMLLLWPAWDGCRASPGAAKSACLSNLKQIGRAASMYMQDYDDTLFWNPAPGGLRTRGRSSSSQPNDCVPQPSESFVVMLLAYMRSTEAFHCPRYSGYELSRHLGYAHSLKATANAMDATGGAAADPAWIRKIGYGFNEVLVGDSCRPRTVASVPHKPGEVALFSEAEQPWASSTGTWMQVGSGWRRCWVWNSVTTARHEGGQIFVFLDGHARFLKPVLMGAEASRYGYFPDTKLE